MNKSDKEFARRFGSKYTGKISPYEAWEAAVEWARNEDSERLAKAGNELKDRLIEILNGANIKTGIVESVSRHAIDSWNKVNKP